MSWQLPMPFGLRIKELDDIALMLLRRGNYSDALDIHKVRYKLILERQAVEKRRLHKGSPLYQIGICLIAKNKPHEGIPYFLKAYAEDVLSEEKVETARELAAYLMLTRYYTFDTVLLEKLEGFVLGRKSKDNFDINTLLTNFLSDQQMDVNELLKHANSLAQIVFNKYSMDNIPGAPHKRVFVGGAYGNYIAIKMMENIVLELEFQPIIADQFTPRKDALITEHSFELLEDSSFAIFEVSVPDGWQYEVERAKARNIPLLCFYQGDKPSRHVSPMLEGYPNSGWKTYDDVKEKIRNFLDEKYKPPACTYGGRSMKADDA